MSSFSTPMMKQYEEIKKQYPHCLLFFRLGDFYELFLEDAKIGARILNITLTRRPRGKDGDIPMAGVPFHAADAYIAKLVKAGYKVAICEQISEPDNRGIVEREVIRIVTPGTILDEKALERKEHNYTLSLSLDSQKIGLAAVDLSTGDFQTTEIDYQKNLENVLLNELARFSPTECILNQSLHSDPQIISILSTQKDMNVYCFPEWESLAEDAFRILTDHFQINNLHGFNLADKKQAQYSSSALLGYLRTTQKDKLAHIKTIRTYSPEDYVLLDRSTIANLELFTTLRDQDQRGSFIEIIDQTVTAMGGRLIRQWIRKPLIKKESIEKRLTAVEELLQNRSTRELLREILRQIYDIPRLVSRLSLGVGNPGDLINLKHSLFSAIEIKSLLSSKVLTSFSQAIPFAIKEIISIINETIEDHPPLDPKSGGIIKNNVNKKLDELRSQVGGGKTWIAKMEEEERKRTGINSLKIKFNRVFGYYIEISKANLSSVPADYMRKQTMVNAERFITPELKVYEEKILLGEEKMNALEYEIFLKTVQRILENTATLQKVAHLIATLDVLASLAEIAEKNQYIRPVLVEQGKIEIINGRHPVVEKLIGSRFVPNDVLLNDNEHQLLVITGPNMAGKSVFMRQVAIITLMAHLGSFVPASSATISLTDRIFVRSGASDVIASGLSTFMVEMVETANILNHATKRSLIIMDEIGRGTSTYDGISIAWAVAEHLVTNPQLQAKTLFATHYHELQMLEKNYPEKIKNFNVAVEEKKDGDPIFLHKVLPGGASHSYAIAVARLAGVPIEVTKKATAMLAKLEEKQLNNNFQKNAEKRFVASEAKNKELWEEVATLDLAQLTPLEALNRLDDLQKRIKND